MEDTWEIPRRRRDLYFKIIDGLSPPHPVAQRLFFLDDHFPPHKLDRALEWLVSHQIVGVWFVRWHKEVCANSDLEMHKILLGIVDNVLIGPVIAGKDFKL